ncbi:MAG: hypothetical protein HKN23_12610 [Verrucomicrobiales bacterium]|nr:hypothetical protein [Verrucomicrobiales bacterium]
MYRIPSAALAILISAVCVGQEEKPGVVSTASDEASKLVNSWFAEGKAAGLEGVFYDNRDRKHSDLRIATYPQMKPITYTKEELGRRQDWGGKKRIEAGKIVVGNSSTASPATVAGSHQRMYYFHPKGLDFLYQQYRSNALYVYPEHRDHDPGINGPDGYGDLYPSNSPYLISSQGSSGSDRVFMHAVLKTIAAFPPDTREKLVAEGLLMPTVQAIFRRTYRAVEKPEDYFSGKAHPGVFDGKLINEVAMVKRAQAMKPEKIPPLVLLKIVDEPEAENGIDFFEPPQRTSETIGNSHCAIARAVRGPEYRRWIQVSAAESVDIADRELEFRWVVLRGNPDLIEIKTEGENAAAAKITVAYHPRRPISPGSSIWSNRVDIGVFAKVKGEGGPVSAPAFVTFMSLPNEHRTYADDGTLIENFYGARTQSPGLPLINNPRWDGLLTKFETGTNSGDEPALAILKTVLEKEQIESLTLAADRSKADRAALSAAQAKLDEITAAQQKVVDETNKVRVAAVAAHKKSPTDETKSALDDANRKHNAAKKVMRDGEDGAAELKKEIAGLRANIVTIIRENGVPQIVRSGLMALRDDPQFFSNHRERIEAAADSPKQKSQLAAAQRRLEFVSVSESENPPANELYHLRRRNLDLLSEVVFPVFLQRPAGPMYVDPRLSIPKNWRDVYRYDKDGNLAGWTRFRGGKQEKYDEQGRLIRDGEPVEVSYEFNSKTKSLDIMIPE